MGRLGAHGHGTAAGGDRESAPENYDQISCCLGRDGGEHDNGTPSGPFLAAVGCKQLEGGRDGQD